MKKRIISLLLGLVLLLILTVPALAESYGGYIEDEQLCLTDSEYGWLQIRASELSDALDMDILYVLTYDTDLDVIAQSVNMGERSDQIMLIENGQEHKIFLFGTAEMLTEEDTKKMLEAYALQTSYFEGVTAYLDTAEELVTEMYNADYYKENCDPIETVVGCPRVVDRANLLNAAEQTVLVQQLDEISQRQQMDIVVVTVNSLGGRTPMAYADDFFDYNGYGFGENHDGILLLVSMEQRDWWISTTGYGITAFTDAGLEHISDRVVPKLSDGRYGKAFEIFAEQCDLFITQARTGEPYDGDHMPKDPFRVGLCLIISVFIGLFTAVCVIWKLQAQLITVHAQSEAREYFLFGRPQLTKNKEIYLHSTMSSIPRLKFEESNGRSGRSFGGSGFSMGSTVHRSSSGRFHGGRGGKF